MRSAKENLASELEEGSFVLVLMHTSDIRTYSNLIEIHLGECFHSANLVKQNESTRSRGKYAKSVLEQKVFKSIPGQHRLVK